MRKNKPDLEQMRQALREEGYILQEDVQKKVSEVLRARRINDLTKELDRVNNRLLWTGIILVGVFLYLIVRG